MSADILQACIEWALKAGQQKLVLHHFGEPLMHPELAARLIKVKEAGLEIQLSTNGVLLDREWDTLVNLQFPITIMISIHQWFKSGDKAYLKALNSYQQRAKGSKVNIVPAYNFKNGQFTIHQWANGNKQKWEMSQCPFIRCQMAVVLWNGEIVTCCVDHEGVTARYNIVDKQAKEHIAAPWSACATCDVGRLMQYEQY